MMKKEALILIGIFIILTWIFFVSAVMIPDDNDGYNSSIDCNNSDSNVWRNMTLYVDNDHDGYGAGNAITICIGLSIPEGYSNVSSDCNDSDANAWKNTVIYADKDHDGYGSENSTIMCLGSTIPTGYSNNSLDCNDSDINIWNAIIGYLDRDGDGYGEISSGLFCALNLPASYVNTDSDCIDTNEDIHPGAIEKCNDIDDNCDNKTDDNFPDKGKACSVGVGECNSTGVFICNKNFNGTICHAIAKNPSPEICDGKDNDCDGPVDEGGICDDTNISFVVILPQNGTYNTNRIPINLSLVLNTNVSVLGKKADKIIYIDNSQTKPREVILCKKCNQYGVISKKSINLKDGEHNLLFKAIMNNGSELDNSVSILIDSKNPRLYLPRIRKKDYINGTFFINYDEDNLKSITLFYDNKNYTESNCSSGKNQVCMIKVNLSEFNGKDIFYSFLVKDISGNLIQTKNFSAEVDITPPKINEISYPVVGSYVFFRFNITEKNFNDISYFDNSYDKAKWKVLCSVLKNEICEKQIRLSPGEHDLTIKISDKAGNAVYVQV